MKRNVNDAVQNLNLVLYTISVYIFIRKKRDISL